jgi:hypothetical protein
VIQKERQGVFWEHEKSDVAKTMVIPTHVPYLLEYMIRFIFPIFALKKWVLFQIHVRREVPLLGECFLSYNTHDICIL